MKSLLIVCVLIVLLAGCGTKQPGTPGATTMEEINPGTNLQLSSGNTTGSSRATVDGAGSVQKKEFTLEELKKYNGQNGNPAYVAVNGTIYDVTNSRRWKNGLHDDCSSSTYAGADFSDLINSSPHGASIMRRMPIVGTLKK